MISSVRYEYWDWPAKNHAVFSGVKMQSREKTSQIQLIIIIIIVGIIIMSCFPFHGDFRQFGFIWQNSA